MFSLLALCNPDVLCFSVVKVLRPFQPQSHGEYED
jgi:hypothetical protein